MPYGTCQGDYKCDSCKCFMLKDSLTWVDLKKRKLYCMKCKPKEALLEDKPRLNSEQRRIFIMGVLLKIYKKRNKKLRLENASLRERRRAS